MSMFIIGIPLFFAAQTEQGAAGIIRHALGDIQLAVQEYQKYKGENAWYIDLKGRSNETLEQVNGKYSVIDVASESAFYVEDKEGHTVTISESTNSDWYVNRAVLEKGEAELTKTFIVQKESIQKERLMKALHLTAKAHKTYVSGKLATEDKAGNIQARTLEYVPLPDLPDALWYHAVDVRVQVKHPPGVEIVELAIENDVPTVPKDEVVEKWFREMGVE